MGRYRGESGQVESPDNADILWVLGDFIDGVYGSIMLSFLVLHVVGGRGLRDVCTWARAPKVVSVKHVVVDSSSSDFVLPEFGNLRAGSKTHMVDAGPV